MIRTERQKNMSSVRTCKCLIDRLLCKLHTERIKNEIDETFVFMCSHECFTLAASSHVCFVQHLTTRFYGFTTHSQLLCSYEKITRPLF
jgi:hypothetical protein